jgi:hypothetical protein
MLMRECIEHIQSKGKVDAQHVSGGDNIADTLTKPLAVPLF